MGDAASRVSTEAFAVYWLSMAKKPGTRKKTTAKSSPSKRATPQPPRTTIAVVIMAAGKGTRLKSKHPKVLHEIGGKPILAHVIATAKKIASAHDIFVIIGHEAERVREAVAGTGVNFVLQAEQRGTGHALMVAREALSGGGNKYDHVIVLSGDAPLITADTIQMLSDFHSAQKASMTSPGLPFTSTLTSFQRRTRTASTTSPIWREFSIALTKRWSQLRLQMPAKCSAATLARR